MNQKVSVDLVRVIIFLENSPKLLIINSLVFQIFVVHSLLHLDYRYGCLMLLRATSMVSVVST